MREQTALNRYRFYIDIPKNIDDIYRNFVSSDMLMKYKFFS